jgi:hypothetical protein
MPSVAVLVRKFHLQSHEEQCHSHFSFDLFRGAGWMEGEGVERNWDYLDGHGLSTVEMLPGHQWETLDDCCGWVNWRKTMGLGALVFWSRQSYCSLFVQAISFSNSC